MGDQIQDPFVAANQPLRSSVSDPSGWFHARHPVFWKRGCQVQHTWTDQKQRFDPRLFWISKFQLSTSLWWAGWILLERCRVDIVIYMFFLSLTHQRFATTIDLTSLYGYSQFGHMQYVRFPHLHRAGCPLARLHHPCRAHEVLRSFEHPAWL